MNKKYLCAVFAIIVTLLTTLIPTDTFAQLDPRGGSISDSSTSSSKTASIDFKYLTVKQKAGASGATSGGNGNLGDQSSKKSTNGRISINVTYTGREESGGRFTNIITGVRNVNITGKDVFHRVENLPYTYDKNGNIVITTEQNNGTDRGLYCTIKVANGTHFADFNSSMQECAKKMDEWLGIGASGSNDSLTYEFGTVTFTDTDGQKTTYNEENKSNAELAEEAGMTEDSPEEAAADAEGSGDVCYDNAGPMGWVICPAVTLLSAFLSSIYESIVVDYLQVESSAIFSEASGTLQAWSSFRDIANVCFVIVFLIIIVSQLTGYGIDNYGIKRMLPRLIIAAILINLSYFICMISVDIANIVGASIGGLLAPTTLGITYPDSLTEGGSVAYGVSLAVIGVGSIAGITAIAINFVPIMVLLGPSGIIMCLLAVLSAAISVLFLWLILVARQAIVVMLIILSPLAMVAYLFPNTENIAKRYIKIAGGTLLLYPICELVVSGGQLAGTILAHIDSEGGTFALAAMIIQVIPFFAIPALLKNSMAGLGNLGAKITNVGRSAQGAFDKARKSDAMQDWHMSSIAKNTKALDSIKKLKGKKGLGWLGNAMGRRQGKANKYVIDKLGQEAVLEQDAAKIKMMQDPKYQDRLGKTRKQERVLDDAKNWTSYYEDQDSDTKQSDFIDAMKNNESESGQIEGIIDSYMKDRDYDGLYTAMRAAGASGADNASMERAAEAMKSNRNFGELSAKRASLGEWAKGPIDDNHDIADAMYQNIGNLKPKDWSSMNSTEREEAFNSVLPALKKLADAGDANAAATYESVAKNMREAANNDNLRGNMDTRVRDRYDKFADSVLGVKKAPIAEQTSGTGRTLDVQNGQRQIVITGDDPRKGLKL